MGARRLVLSDIDISGSSAAWYVKLGTARVFSRDSPEKVAQWTGRPIRES
jgi:hypothetical protein